jgi:hypothetical protein
LDTIRVIIHGEAVAFRVRHHEGYPPDLSVLGGVGLLPPPPPSGSS